MALAQRVRAMALKVVRKKAGVENFMSSPMWFFDLITVKLGTPFNGHRGLQIVSDVTI
jgi:hypothetical protein